MVEVYLGQVVLFGFDFAPQRFMKCEGQALSISVHQSLFRLIGTTYGGDGRTTFKIPDLGNQALLDGLNYYICIAGTYPPRS